MFQTARPLGSDEGDLAGVGRQERRGPGGLPPEGGAHPGATRAHSRASTGAARQVKTTAETPLPPLHHRVRTPIGSPPNPPLPLHPILPSPDLTHFAVGGGSMALDVYADRLDVSLVLAICALTFSLFKWCYVSVVFAGGDDKKSSNDPPPPTKPPSSAAAKAAETATKPAAAADADADAAAAKPAAPEGTPATASKPSTSSSPPEASSSSSSSLSPPVSADHVAIDLSGETTTASALTPVAQSRIKLLLQSSTLQVIAAACVPVAMFIYVLAKMYDEDEKDARDLLLPLSSIFLTSAVIDVAADMFAIHSGLGRMGVVSQLSSFLASSSATIAAILLISMHAWTSALPAVLVAATSVQSAVALLTRLVLMCNNIVAGGPAVVDSAAATVLPPPRGSASSSKAVMMFRLLKPYVWPESTATSATVNRLRSVLTWVFVVASKVCSLWAPIFIGQAATAVASGNLPAALKYSILYGVLSLLARLFKEAQSLVYLRVAQAGFIQIATASFAHLHSLSLGWHLSKKMGEVLRSMDRGIAACDQLMNWLFLWLVPAFAECVAVCIIFAVRYQFPPLSIACFFFVMAYTFITIVITLWRKKFRQKVRRRFVFFFTLLSRCFRLSVLVVSSHLNSTSNSPLSSSPLQD